MLYRATLFGAIIAIVGCLPALASAQVGRDEPKPTHTLPPIDLAKYMPPFLQIGQKGDELFLTLLGAPVRSEVVIDGAASLPLPSYPSAISVPHFDTNLELYKDVTALFPEGLGGTAAKVQGDLQKIASDLTNGVNAFNMALSNDKDPGASIDCNGLRSRFTNAQTGLIKLRKGFNDLESGVKERFATAADPMDLWDRAQREIDAALKKVTDESASATQSFKQRLTRHFTYRFTGGRQKLTATIITLGAGEDHVITRQELGTISEPVMQPPLILALGVFYDPLVSDQANDRLGPSSFPKSIGMQVNLKGPEILRAPLRPFVGIGFDPNEDARLLLGLSVAADGRSRSVWFDFGLACGDVTRIGPTSHATLVGLTFGFSVNFWTR